MQNKFKKVGIIGLGVGERHLSTLNQKDDIDVKVVCDIDPIKRNILKIMVKALISQRLQMKSWNLM